MVPSFRVWLLATACVFSISASAQAEKLAPLAPAPDWSSLNAYQYTITRGEFSRLLSTVYSMDGGFAAYGPGVEFCVVGLDRNWAFNPACKAARP